MTVQQVAEYLEAYSRKRLDKIYPELFGKKKIDISTMTPEQIERATVNAWSVFLGI